MIFVFSGAINSGKSTRLVHHLKELKTQGISVSGVVTPPYLISGKKEGHDCVLIKNSIFGSPVRFTREHSFPGSFRWKRFHFDPDVFSTANSLETDSDLFVIDEIGPLELQEKIGFWSLFIRAIVSCPKLLLVTRQQCLETLTSNIGHCDVAVVSGIEEINFIRANSGKKRMKQNRRPILS